MLDDFEKALPPHPGEICPAKGTQDITVCVPVEVKPFADVGKVKTKCMGKPVTKHCCDKCEGKLKETCKFTISQKISVEVPVVFGAKTDVGKTFIDCECRDHDHGHDSHYDCLSPRD